MKDFFNAYQILGVKQNDSITVIKKAWMLARSKSHPDRGGKPEDFKKFKMAWEILSTTASRQSHDVDIDYYEKNKASGGFTSESNKSPNNRNRYQNSTSDFIHHKQPNVLYEIQATFAQIVEILGRGGYCQFSIDGETMRGTIQLEQGTLLKHGKIYPFMSFGVRYNIRLTWEWDLPWKWDDKYGQVYSIEMTEHNIRSGGKQNIVLPTFEKIAFSWKPLAETASIKNGLWVKLKKQGWPTDINDNPDAWVHLIPVSSKKLAKKKMSIVGKAAYHFIGGARELFVAMPLFMWRAMAIVAGIFAVSWIMDNMKNFHF